MIDNSVAACAYDVLPPRGGLEFAQVDVREHYLFMVDDVVKPTQDAVDQLSRPSKLDSKQYNGRSRKKILRMRPYVNLAVVATPLAMR